ncbi:uncharacterized protein ASCRUDRAFT_72367 [Ascoidea rubescens DSM 1968]|uniref:Protein kinase domain-containing protein n=1 Tax=Ascoidea rubescens DSM 1968 TaxID=1344418 RepID=A0A1D2VAJ0_9ASCO|nr:hypothetical protein ASCRUDRAFT_72367 [Ascoidea rubescens DSM 1968]ODV58688.1 hypothetical protein ASCRUDRAFT_72367 [Ascoidea rubescens DSM 1968]
MLCLANSDSAQTNGKKLKEQLEYSDFHQWTTNTKENSYHFYSSRYLNRYNKPLKKFQKIILNDVIPKQFSPQKVYWSQVFQASKSLYSQFGIAGYNNNGIIKIYDARYVANSDLITTTERSSAIQQCKNYYSKGIQQFIIERRIFNVMNKYQPEYLPALLCDSRMEGTYNSNNKSYSPNGPFLFMEHLEDHQNLIEETDLKRVANQGLCVLKTFYQNNIIHGDIKRSNLIVNFQNNKNTIKFWYIDFGFSKSFKKTNTSYTLGENDKYKDKIQMKLDDINGHKWT